MKLVADAYGSKVVYDGKVAGLGMATGAASALLPAQNATGNWIKVVQRVPVRIALEPEQLKAHPLRVGLSMEAKVDIADQSGTELASASRAGDAARTQVFAQADQGADQRVQTIIAQNMGAPAPANAPTGAPAAPAAQRPASVNGNTPAGASHATHAATTTQHAG